MRLFAEWVVDDVNRRLANEAAEMELEDAFGAVDFHQAEGFELIFAKLKHWTLAASRRQVALKKWIAARLEAKRRAHAELRCSMR